MHEAQIQRTLEILSAYRRLSLPLEQLARRLGTLDIEGLAARLAADPRILVLEPRGFPALTLPEDRRKAYLEALEAAGVSACRRVALAPGFDAAGIDATGRGRASTGTPGPTGHPGSGRRPGHKGATADSGRTRDPDAPSASVSDLLRRTAARLLTAGPDGATLVAVAERARQALESAGDPARGDTTKDA